MFWPLAWYVGIAFLLLTHFVVASGGRFYFASYGPLCLASGYFVAVILSLVGRWRRSIAVLLLAMIGSSFVYFNLESTRRIDLPPNWTPILSRTSQENYRSLYVRDYDMARCIGRHLPIESKVYGIPYPCPREWMCSYILEEDPIAASMRTARSRNEILQEVRRWNISHLCLRNDAFEEEQASQPLLDFRQHLRLICRRGDRNLYEVLPKVASAVGSADHPPLLEERERRIETGVEN
jgi:hypothetical protein